MNPTQDGFIEADGHRLEYRWAGERAAEPTLVLLHEGLGCVAMWRDFPERLAETTGSGVFVYSRAGYGRSDPVALPRPVRYMHHEGLVVLPQVLERAGIRRAVLVGHSDGGSIAIVHAGSGQAKRVEGLILLAAHVFNEQICVQSIRAAREAYLEGGLRERLSRHHGARVDNAFWGWNDVWLHPDFWHWNIEEYLPGIRVPALVMQGREDPYGTVRQVDAIEAGLSGPVQRLMLADCGHAPQRDQPEATLVGITEFLAGLGTAARASGERIDAGGSP